MKPEYVKGAALPPSVGLCADLYREVRDLRLAMERKVDEVKARESEIKEHIINTLSASDDTGAAGKRYRAQIVRKEKPKLEPDTGWARFTAFIQQTGRFDLLTKRLSDQAIQEVWDAGESIPGIEKMFVKDVSITKI